MNIWFKRTFRISRNRW